MHVLKRTLWLYCGGIHNGGKKYGLGAAVYVCREIIIVWGELGVVDTEPGGWSSEVIY